MSKWGSQTRHFRQTVEFIVFSGPDGGSWNNWRDSKKGSGKVLESASNQEKPNVRSFLPMVCLPVGLTVKKSCFKGFLEGGGF